MLALDMVWLGLVAADLYNKALGHLMRPQPHLPAAVLFYAMYTVATYVHAVRGATSLAQAAKRGAGLGLVAYSTYELTSWAVLREWPSILVPVDTLWGMALTATAATLGFVAVRLPPRHA
jgi:uncharacterized membrane protein